MVAVLPTFVHNAVTSVHDISLLDWEGPLRAKSIFSTIADVSMAFPGTPGRGVRSHPGGCTSGECAARIHKLRPALKDVPLAELTGQLRAPRLQTCISRLLLGGLVPSFGPSALRCSGEAVRRVCESA